MSRLLKIVSLLAIALTLANGQCIANCIAFPCQSQVDAGMPPCHQHHPPASHSCAQPASLANVATLVQPLDFLAAAPPLASIEIAIERRPQASELRPSPDSPPPFFLALRI